MDNILERTRRFILNERAICLSKWSAEAFICHELRTCHPESCSKTERRLPHLLETLKKQKFKQSADDYESAEHFLLCKVLVAELKLHNWIRKTQTE